MAAGRTNETVGFGDAHVAARRTVGEMAAWQE
jgi:hypothetical protein